MWQVQVWCHIYISMKDSIKYQLNLNQKTGFKAAALDQLVRPLNIFPFYPLSTSWAYTYFFLRGLLQESQPISILALLNVECQSNFFKYNICHFIALFRDLQWHFIFCRMKNRFLPTGSNYSNMNLSFSPAYLWLLLISSSVSVSHPPSPN